MSTTEEDILKSLEEEANELDALLKSSEGETEIDDELLKSDDDPGYEDDPADDPDDDMVKSLEQYNDDAGDTYVDAAPLLQKSLDVQSNFNDRLGSQEELLKSIAKTVSSLAKVVGRIAGSPQPEKGMEQPNLFTLQNLAKSKENSEKSVTQKTQTDYRKAMTALMKSFQDKDSPIKRFDIQRLEQGGILTENAKLVLEKELAS